MSSSKLFFISNEAYLNSSVLPSLLFVCESNGGIRIYQFTLELLYFCFRNVVLVSDLKKILAYRRICMLLTTPSHQEAERSNKNNVYRPSAPTHFAREMFTTERTALLAEFFFL